MTQIDDVKDNIGMPVAVMGFTEEIEVTPTIVPAAYSANDLIGGKNTVSAIFRENGGTGTIHTVVVTDQAGQNVELDLVFFDEDPTGTTFTDNSPLTVADADLKNIVGVINIPSANYISFVNNSVAVVDNIGQVMKAAADADDLFMAVITRGAPTYAAADDLQIKLLMLQD